MAPVRKAGLSTSGQMLANSSDPALHRLPPSVAAVPHRGLGLHVGSIWRSSSYLRSSWSPATTRSSSSPCAGRCTLLKWSGPHEKRWARRWSPRRHVFTTPLAPKSDRGVLHSGASPESAVAAAIANWTTAMLQSAAMALAGGSFIERRRSCIAVQSRSVACSAVPTPARGPSPSAARPLQSSTWLCSCCGLSSSPTVSDSGLSDWPSARAGRPKPRSAARCWLSSAKGLGCRSAPPPFVACARGRCQDPRRPCSFVDSEPTATFEPGTELYRMTMHLLFVILFRGIAKPYPELNLGASAPAHTSAHKRTHRERTQRCQPRPILPITMCRKPELVS